MELYWSKCKGDVWCLFDKIDLEHGYIKGVRGIFVLWIINQGTEVIKIGSGNITEELKLLRNDRSITAFSKYNIFVTWAECSSSKFDGIENYLNVKLNPKIKPQNMGKKSIEVNLPW